MKSYCKTFLKGLFLVLAFFLIDSSCRAEDVYPESNFVAVQYPTFYYNAYGGNTNYPFYTASTSGYVPYEGAEYSAAYSAGDTIFSLSGHGAVVDHSIIALEQGDGHLQVTFQTLVTMAENSGGNLGVWALGGYEYQLTTSTAGTYNFNWDIGEIYGGSAICYYTIDTTTDGRVIDQTVPFNALDSYYNEVYVNAGDTITVRLNISQLAQVCWIGSNGLKSEVVNWTAAYGTGTPSPTPTITPIPPTPAAGEDTAGTANSGNQITIIGKLGQLISDIASLPSRIASSIGGFFTDLGNSIIGALDALLQGILDGLEYLFIPDDFSGLIESNLEDLKDSMGILYIPIDLVERIFKVLTWHGSASLSFDGYTLPGYSDPVIPAFSYTFTLSDYLGSTYSYIISMILCASLIYLSAKTTLNHIFGTDVPDPINEGDED